LKAVDVVTAMGCRVACVIAMLDRLEGAAGAFRARGLTLHALCTIADLGVSPLGTDSEVS
jgi:orotate phosphoribosyltransferase